MIGPVDIAIVCEALVEAVRWRTAASREASAYAEEGGPEIPAGADYLWHWFLDLHAARSSNGFGSNPVAYSEIESYAHMMNVEMRPHEATILRAMDDAWLEIVNRPEGEKRKPVTFSTKDSKAMLGLFRGMRN